MCVNFLFTWLPGYLVFERHRQTVTDVVLKKKGPSFPPPPLPVARLGAVHQQSRLIIHWLALIARINHFIHGPSELSNGTTPTHRSPQEPTNPNTPARQFSWAALHRSTVAALLAVADIDGAVSEGKAAVTRTYPSHTSQ